MNRDSDIGAYDSNLEDGFDQFTTQRGDIQRRALANRLVDDEGLLWTDQDVDLLLNELEIEVGEGTNRFLYQDERVLYCHGLSQAIQFQQPRSPDQIHDKIIWLWTTWEAISRATGKSWWNISERDKYSLSLLSHDKDQLLKSKFKYFDKCDRIFAYIRRDEGEDDENKMSDDASSIYY
ncbi:hypothetical protein BD408DRAFT_444966 [Parasitella parasitica]|nr:hypothetical protein BD408DRAFT_444966 [Parasitella parasitica]